MSRGVTTCYDFCYLWKKVTCRIALLFARNIAEDEGLFLIKNNTQYLNVMKNLGTLLAFLGGAAVGVMAGVLFAPEKGEETRSRIRHSLEEKGVPMTKEDVEKIVEKIKGKAAKVEE